jgi:hypothetical protein
MGCKRGTNLTGNSKLFDWFHSPSNHSRWRMAMATVAFWLRQSAGGEGGVKSHMIEHAFEQ